jgi:hypothetical protein
MILTRPSKAAQPHQVPFLTNRHVISFTSIPNAALPRFPVNSLLVSSRNTFAKIAELWLGTTSGIVNDLIKRVEGV